MKKLLLILLLSVCFYTCQTDQEILLINTDLEVTDFDEKTTSFLQLDTLYIPSSSGSQIPLTKYDREFYQLGDILLNKEQVLLLQREGSINKTVATASLTKRWPNLTIPYRFHPSFSNIQLVRNALNRINGGATCINFIEMASHETASSYIEFVNTSDPGIGGYSALGRQGGKQEIGINQQPGEASIGTVIHEMGHALGLWHEHQSSNRTNFITVNTGNIMPEFLNQFSIPANIDIIGDFDFDSIMIYDSDAFSINPNNCQDGGDTSGCSMTRIDGTYFDDRDFNFSQGDYETITQIHSFDHQTDGRIAGKSFDRVLIDYEYSNDTQYREEEFYLNFSSPLTSPLTIRYQISETVSNIQSNPSGSNTTFSNHIRTLQPGQSSYLIRTLITLDRYYDYGSPDGPQYSRNCYLWNECFSNFRLSK